MAAIAFDTMGYSILFVLFLVITIMFVANPATRAKIMETGQYVLDRIKCILGFECFGTDDDTTAIDSTKALACAIDVTAYWSDTTDPKRAAALKARLEDIKNPDAPKGLFDDSMGDRIPSCTGEINAPPTTNAIRASSGGIISKLIEWSGGGNGITGNAVGNRATGYGIFDWLDNIDGAEKCALKDEKNKDMPTCASASGPENAHDCKEGEKITCCEEGANTNKYCCNDGYGADGNGGCKKLSGEEIKAEAVEQANDVLRDNEGKAMRFGQTAVVCGKGIENKLNNPVCCQSDFSIQYREGTCIGDEIQVDKSICGSTGESDNFSCQVKAFELPQYVKGDIIDYVAKWVGVFGEPKYLVYHETFPIGIEAVWTYSWEDSIISAAAVGGLFNLGGGAMKSAWAGVKATSKGMAIAVVKREGFGAAISAGKTAATERLALEYGGGVAFRKILARQFSSSFHGIPQIEGKTFSVLEKAMLLRAENGGAELARVHKILTPAQQKKFMADMSLIVRSEGDDVSLDVLQKMADDTGVDNAIKYASKSSGTAAAPLDISKLAGELKGMKQTWKEGNLLSETEKKELQETMTKEVGEATAKSAGMQALVGRSAKDGLWVFANLRALLKTPGYKEAFAKNMKAEAEELAKETYDDILRTTYNLEKTCGQKCAETYIDGIYVETYKGLKVEVPSDLKSYITEGDATGALSQLKDDAVSVLKGVTGQKRTGSWYTFDRQKKVMAVTLAVSYLAQKKDANMEKYKSCGQGKLCLHIPKWFLLQREFFSDKESTQSYGDGTDVKKSFNDLVSLTGFKDNGQASGATVRMNLMSPCKADIRVKADSSACKCTNFYGADKVWFKLQKNRCVVKLSETNIYTVYTMPDGNCPATVKTKDPFTNKETVFNVENEVEGLSKVYSCAISDNNNLLNDLEYCGRKIIYSEMSCVHDVLKSMPGYVASDPEVFRKLFLSASPDELNKCVAEDVFKECSCNPTKRSCTGGISYDGVELGSMSKAPGGIGCTGLTVGLAPPLLKYDYPKDAYKNRDISFLPVNILPSVDSGKPVETISVCENSWVSGALSGATEEKCITVTPEPNSMETYSDAGFGTNFCAENKASFAAKVEDACFWGTIAVSIGAELASMGAATPAVLFAVGSGGAACEKIVGMESKWPKSQY